MNNDFKSSNNHGNSNKVILIVIAVLLAVLVLFLGYYLFFYDKDGKTNNESNSQMTENNSNGSNDQNNNSSTGTATVTKDLSLDNELVVKLSKVFSGKFLTYDGVYDNYFYRNNKTLLSSVENAFKLEIAFRMLNVNDFASFSSDTLKTSYESIFGLGTYVPGDLSECPGYKYNASTNQYVASTTGCGGTHCGDSYSKLVKAKSIKDGTSEKIIITEAVAFSECPLSVVINGVSGQNGNTTKFYKDINKTEFVEIYDYTKNPLDVDTSKYAHYDYTFVKDSNGTYVFTSVERVK